MSWTETKTYEKHIWEKNSITLFFSFVNKGCIENTGVLLLHLYSDWTVSYIVDSHTGSLWWLWTNYCIQNHHSTANCCMQPQRLVKKCMCVSTHTIYQHRQQKLGGLCLNIQNSVLALSLIRIESNSHMKLNSWKGYSLKLNFHQLKIWQIVNSIQNWWNFVSHECQEVIISILSSIDMSKLFLF